MDVLRRLPRAYNQTAPWSRVLSGAIKSKLFVFLRSQSSSRVLSGAKVQVICFPSISKLDSLPVDGSGGVLFHLFGRRLAKSLIEILCAFGCLLPGASLFQAQYRESVPYSKKL